MRRPSLFASLLLSLSAACSSPTSPADDAGNTPHDSGVDAPIALEDGGEDAARLDAGPEDTGVLDVGLVEDAGVADFTVEIVEPYAYGNCFGGPPDPLMLSWTARVTGEAGTIVTLSQATLHVAVPAESYTGEQTISVEAPSFSITGSGTVDAEQRKITTGAPVIPICTFCDAEITASFTATYTSDSGGTVTVDTPLVGVGCVF